MASAVAYLIVLVLKAVTTTTTVAKMMVQLFDDYEWAHCDAVPKVTLVGDVRPAKMMVHLLDDYEWAHCDAVPNLKVTLVELQLYGMCGPPPRSR
jgi:hypothetical protein